MVPMATEFAEVMGWLPAYLRLFIIVAGVAGSLCIVNLRSDEPLNKAWYMGSLFFGGSATLTSIPGLWLAVTVEQLPIFAAIPFGVGLLAGIGLLSMSASRRPHEGAAS